MTYYFTCFEYIRTEISWVCYDAINKFYVLDYDTKTDIYEYIGDTNEDTYQV